MFNKIKRLFKKEEKKELFKTNKIVVFSKEINLFRFTDNQTLLVKENQVLGKINKVEKIKPGSLGKGAISYIYLFEAEVLNGGRSEFLTFEAALEFLLQGTADHWTS